MVSSLKEFPTSFAGEAQMLCWWFKVAGQVGLEPIASGGVRGDRHPIGDSRFAGVGRGRERKTPQRAPDELCQSRRVWQRRRFLERHRHSTISFVDLQRIPRRFAVGVCSGRIEMGVEWREWSGGSGVEGVE